MFLHKNPKAISKEKFNAHVCGNVCIVKLFFALNYLFISISGNCSKTDCTNPKGGILALLK